MLCVVRIFKALRGKCMSCDWDCGDKSDLTCEEDMCRGVFFSILQETPGTYSVIHSPCGRSSRFPIQFKGQQNTRLKVQQVLQFELFS